MPKNDQNAISDSKLNDKNSELSKNQIRELVDESPVLLSWSALEYVHHERGPTWYLIGAIISVTLIIYAVITQQWSMAIVIALLMGVIYLYSHEIPKIKEIFITKLGIEVGKESYLYSNISSFWLIFNQESQLLNIQLANKSQDVISIQLADQDPVLIREILTQYITEADGKEENFIDKLGRMLKI